MDAPAISDCIYAVCIGTAYWRWTCRVLAIQCLGIHIVGDKKSTNGHVCSVGGFHKSWHSGVGDDGNITFNLEQALYLDILVFKYKKEYILFDSVDIHLK